MGTTKEYIIFFVSSFVSVTAVMVLLALLQPSFFSLIPGTIPEDPGVHASDETEVAEAKVDSSAAQKQEPPIATNVKVDSSSSSSSSSLHGAADTTKNLQQELVALGIKPVVQQEALQDTLNHADTKKTVEILESMDAEKAAKILNNMDEFAVQQVIRAMKKRQSAKILAVLEPEQAARILKGKMKK